MADNVTLNSGIGGATLGTDDVGGVQIQRVKATWGPDGTANDTDVASGKPMPIQLRTSTGTEIATAAAPLRTDPTGTTAQPVTDNGGALTVDGTITANAGTGTFTTDQANAAEADYDTGAGTVNQVMMGLALPGSGGPVAGGTSSNPVRTDPTGTTAQPVTDNAGSLTVDSGQLPATLGQKAMAASMAVVVASDQSAVPVSQSGTWTVQPGNTANTTAWLVSARPATSGGHSIYRLISAATTNAASIKGSAGQVYGAIITNTNAAVRYVKLYNKATAPTVGTDIPVMTLAIPGNTAGAGMVFSFENGIAFGTGIGSATTTGAADSDTGAVAANEIIVNLFYT